MSLLMHVPFADGTLTVTPEEPATLTLALVGLATLAIYAAFSGWRPKRAATAIDSHSVGVHADSTAASQELIARRAA